MGSFGRLESGGGDAVVGGGLGGREKWRSVVKVGGEVLPWPRFCPLTPG